MAMIGLLMIMSVEVHGIPMIPSCPAIIFYETAKLINEGFTEVKDQGATLNGTVNRVSGTVSQMREDLAEVKNQGSVLNQTVNQMQEELTDLAEVKKQVSALNGTVNGIREGLVEVKNLLVSLQQTVGAFESSNLCEYKTLYSYTSRPIILCRLCIGTVDNHGNTEITETMIFVKCRDFAKMSCFFAKMH